MGYTRRGKSKKCLPQLANCESFSLIHTCNANANANARKCSCELLSNANATQAHAPTQEIQIFSFTYSRILRLRFHLTRMNRRRANRKMQIQGKTDTCSMPLRLTLKMASSTVVIQPRALESIMYFTTKVAPISKIN